jgi:hypothetical protein
MKKLSLLCAMALVLVTLCVPQVYGVTYNVTIPDGVTYATVNNPPGTASGNAYWDNNNEPVETEPGTQTSKAWDLQSFQQTGYSITMTGGYDFKNGYGDPIFKPGDLFIAAYSSGNAVPNYGLTNPAFNGYNVYGYNYAVVADFPNNRYNVYAINPYVDTTNKGTAVNGVFYPQFNFSNPWQVKLNGETNVGTGTLNYTGVAGDYTLEYAGLLALLTEFQGANLPNAYAYLHYTYECGNDFMMGVPTGVNVPLPPSAILLGSGLLGLVGLGWRRRKTNV